jgi:hypothetical protein
MDEVVAEENVEFDDLQERIEIDSQTIYEYEEYQVVNDEPPEEFIDEEIEVIDQEPAPVAVELVVTPVKPPKSNRQLYKCHLCGFSTEVRDSLFEHFDLRHPK